MPDSHDDHDEHRPIIARVGTTLERRRFAFQAIADIVAWGLGLYLATILRFEFQTTSWGSFTAIDVLLAAGCASAFQVLAGALSGLYRGRYRYGSFDEIAHLVRSVVVATVALAVVNRALPDQLVPTSVPFIGGLAALLVMTGVRYMWRLLLERSLRPSADHAARVVVFGAGEGGVQVITAMLRNPDSPLVPVALLDDDPTKRHLRIMGVHVVGTRNDIVRVARELDAGTLLIAIPSATADLLRELTDMALAEHLDVQVLPPISELFGAAIGLADIRPVTEADLLGRHEIDTDLDAIAGYLTNRRVLVTGAGGSIGSELCRQIARFGPAQLVMADRDESALHGVQLMIEGRALLDDPNIVVCDIRDLDRLHDVFGRHRPEVVFHAAALKHLPLLEQHPSEALKTNIYGTDNVLAAATAVGVERFVNISTDKAADPCSVLGYSKRIAERLTADVAHRCERGTYLSVRFGNVLGSRGSVLTAFRAQVDAGGPITVTDPEVTRYFMTVEEAVQLVVQAGAVGNDGEALVLDMGDPVRIDDVARRLAAQADRPIDVVYTGLRRGEKLHEQLLGAGETDRRPAHHLISHVSVPPLSVHDVHLATAGLDDTDLVLELRRLAYETDPSAAVDEADVGGDRPEES